MTIHYDMSFDAYRRLDGWNWSLIKLLRDGSPLHVQHAMTAPDDDTASRVWLRAVHCLVLEPHHFDAQFTVYEGRRDKRIKAYQSFLAEVGNRDVINVKEHASALETARHITAHPEVAKLLEHGHPEVTIQWSDPMTGLLCKGRIDWLATDGDGNPRAIVDLKTLGTAHPRQVGSLVARNGYHGQLAHYHEGCKDLGLGDLDVFVISAEGKGAQDVGVFDLGAGIIGSALHAGREMRAELVRTLVTCVESDRWPGCTPTVEDLTMPGWAYPDEGGE